jgi:thiosulfate reductase cytochrome b subunit
MLGDIMHGSSRKGTTRIHWIFRHSLTVRITHWINAACLTVLLLSGLQIFNAHSALYWGKQSDFRHPLVQIAAESDGGVQKGATTIFGRKFDTTGFLGFIPGSDGKDAERGFPSWITLPGEQNLAVGRRWHFFFAWLLVLNGVVYLISGFATGHFRSDLLPTSDQLRHIRRSLLDHIRLRFPRGDEARRYNVLQKLSYLVVILILLPVVVAAGLAMSPGIDTIVPQLPWVFGGRQSARTIHFSIAWLLTLFVIGHVVMVMISGFWNEMRSMITGRFSLKEVIDERSATPAA